MDEHLQSIAEGIGKGDLDEAARQIDAVAVSDENRADVLYLRGYRAEKAHAYEEAIELYEQALESEADHRLTLFRLAYVLDLHDEGDRAIELYRRCTEATPAPLNALLNLAVCYEDGGRYDEAESCLLRVLKDYPNHTRARLFLRDVQAAKEMYYDEELERVRQEHNAVLDTPVSDFELSVRSRNCLKQMSIQTLGDLLKTSEAELLAYKNFGETSLNEIKAMLSQKGLRLGQIMDDSQPDLSALRMAPATVGSPDVLNRSVAELELSARSRKCLQRLGVTSLGELASRSEQELLAIKNFGQTSLQEIKRCLAEVGLSLRPPQR